MPLTISDIQLSGAGYKPCESCDFTRSNCQGQITKVKLHKIGKYGK